MHLSDPAAATYTVTETGDSETGNHRQAAAPGRDRDATRVDPARSRLGAAGKPLSIGGCYFFPLPMTTAVATAVATATPTFIAALPTSLATSPAALVQEGHNSWS